MKNKIKSSAFWISITSVLIVIINVVGKFLNVDIDLMSIISITSCVIGMLITVGILSKDNILKDKDIKLQVKDEIMENLNKLDESLLKNSNNTNDELEKKCKK